MHHFEWSEPCTNNDQCYFCKTEYKIHYMSLITLMANIHNRNHTKDIIHPSNKSGLAWVVETLIRKLCKKEYSIYWMEKNSKKTSHNNWSKKKKILIHELSNLSHCLNFLKCISYRTNWRVFVQITNKTYWGHLINNYLLLWDV